MKADTQHLDFLISQYVDGCLDSASKKSIEQQLHNDPVARTLYNDHREVQDLLDDWGNRIPLINWDDFDRKLASRLDQETVGGQRRLFIRRWMRPVAAAAALFIAASLGYSWHAWWSRGNAGTGTTIATPISAGSHTSVAFPESERSSVASKASFRLEEPGAQSVTPSIDPKAVAVTTPGDAAAAESLKQAVGFGMKLPDAVNPAGGAPSSSVAVGLPQEKKDKKSDPLLPYP